MWTAGIDEAGYGPTLGPLVLSLASLDGPSESLAAAADDPGALRRSLRSVVGRRPDRGFRRLPVDDSKALYRPGGGGLAPLEESVLGILYAADGAMPPTFEALLGRVGRLGLGGCDRPLWYEGRADLALPLAGCAERAERYGRRLRRALVERGWTLDVATTPIAESRLNRGIEERGNKASALFVELLRLLEDRLPSGHDRDVRVDRLGGRVYYAELLREAFPDCDIRVVSEAPARSLYRVDSLFGGLRLEFRMKADRDDLLVAIASMLSKYVRELFMECFNRFWSKQVRGLRPTAGYPVDAGRFLRSVRPRFLALGIEERELVRSR